MDELVAIARIVRPRGLKGELVAELMTDFPERFEGLGAVTALSPDGDRLQLMIEKFWFQNDRIILKFASYDTIERAEELRDREICISESEAVELESDEFFDWQLEGCQVESIDGKRIGEVQKLMRTGGTELLVVKGDTKEYLIPFAESICVEVDIENKRIKIDPPEGLLEF
jgi:16S rRNA processing protein RimM